MKEIIYNYDNLKEEDINDKSYRSRGLIINSNKEILLGCLDGAYQFPGGHLDGNETIMECLLREILEETGLEISKDIPKLFYRIKYYNKDYPKEGINRYTEFDYYLIETDERYNIDNMHLDEKELELGYTLRYVKFEDFEKLLNSTINDNPRNKGFYPEMINIFEEYRSRFYEK